MKQETVYMGTMPVLWGASKNIKHITFSVTDDCNLRCTYCYFTHKTDRNKMSFSVAKAAVDNILSTEEFKKHDGVVWEFIGGEPTLEMALIDQISDYILVQMYRLKHKWLDCYHFMIGTNGLLYDSPPVQKYINKHLHNLYVAVTIDGSKSKHDLSRIKKDGSGSYDDVARIIPLWKKQFGATSTKATFSHDDLPYLKESIVNLWNLGIDNVAANIVFENVWLDGDTEIYKDQLYQLADYVIENDLWYDYSVRFFDPNVGNPIDESLTKINFCGTGTMMAISTKGEYYPCVRFMPSATDNRTFSKIGDIDSGVDSDRLRAFATLSMKNQSPVKCMECDIAGGCTWCSALNYDYSFLGTVFERQTFICEMHKANVEVNKYLWRKYELIKNKISPYRYRKLTAVSKYNKFMYVLCKSDFPSICNYLNQSIETTEMTAQMIGQVIDFCEHNNYVPIFCGCENLPDDYYGYQIIPYNCYTNGSIKPHKNYISNFLVNEREIDESFLLNFDNLNIIVVCEKHNISDLYSKLFIIIQKCKFINIKLSFIDSSLISDKDFLEEYDVFLRNLADLILREWQNNNYVNVNVLTNELFANSARYCGAGENSITVGPDGFFYLCPAFYYNQSSENVGNINDGLLNIYRDACKMENAPLCSGCIVRHCERCIYMNEVRTGELVIPSEVQCVQACLEYRYSRLFVKRVLEANLQVPFEFNQNLIELSSLDPLKNIRGDHYLSKQLEKYINEKEEDLIEKGGINNFVG